MAKFVKHTRNARRSPQKPTPGQERTPKAYEQLFTSLKAKAHQIEKSKSIVAARKARNQ